MKQHLTSIRKRLLLSLIPLSLALLLTIAGCEPTTITITPTPSQPEQEQPETPEPTPEIPPAPVPVSPTPEPDATPTPTPMPTSTPSLSINQSGYTPGSNVGIGGSGFTPGETVIVTFDNMEVARVTADTDGLIMAIFQVPDKAPGVYMIRGSDGVNTAEDFFTIAVPPPSTPVPEE
jgi:hypothetical protein